MLSPPGLLAIRVVRQFADHLDPIPTRYRDLKISCGVGFGIYKNEQPNENTIGLISGSPNSDDTYLQMAYDLADVLNDDDNLRILPIAGIGGPRNIRDVRYLRGVDIGLTQTSILNSYRRSNEGMGHFDNKIVYIAKLFNEEVHLVARSNITSIEQL